MGHIFVTMAVTGNYKNIQYKNIKTDEENKFVRTRSEDADAVPVINNKAGPGTAETEQLSTTNHGDDDDDEVLMNMIRSWQFGSFSSVVLQLYDFSSLFIQISHLFNNNSRVSVVLMRKQLENAIV